LKDIDAILITHEHTDHIKGLVTLALRHKIPIFANADTAKAIHDNLDGVPKFKIFSTGETFEFGDIEVHPFSIQHDTLDPVAFTIRTGMAFYAVLLVQLRIAASGGNAGSPSATLFIRMFALQPRDSRNGRGSRVLT
jgi:phosphoribosyl 1,2-cyclic phosphodiesterase